MGQKCTCFQCIPAHEAEAQTIIPGLIPLFRHRHGKGIEISFIPDTVKQMSNATSEKATRKVFSQTDVHISTIDEGDTKFLLAEDAAQQAPAHKTK